MGFPITESIDITVNYLAASLTRFSFGSLLGVFDHSVTANRQDGPYVSLPEVVAAGFTSVAEPEVYAWAQSVFAQENGIDQVIIGREDALDADWTATMAAVHAAGPTSYYFINTETRTEAEILLVGAFVEACDPVKIYIPQSADAAILAGTPGNVALDLQTATYKRTALIYHATSTGTYGYLDGGWTSLCGGFNLDQPNGQGDWFYKSPAGQTADAFTTTQAGEIKDASANAYGALGGGACVMWGWTAGGRFIDTTVSLDWLKIRLQEAVIAGFLRRQPRTPFTNDGIAAVCADIKGVLKRGQEYGHLSKDYEPVVNRPDIREISAANKAARTLTPLTGSAVMEGGIIKVEFTMNLTP